MRHDLFVHRTLLPALVCCALAAPAAAQDAWTVLAAARAEFERTAWTADFVQTYVPAGFSSGETETGRVSVALPGTLRWDYDVPYAKVFLVRDDMAYTWNPGESTGRRTLLAPAEREHLALLELDLAALEARYEAALTHLEGGPEVTLTPLDETADIRAATLALEPASYRLLRLRYSDFEGNTTEFRLSGHRVAADTGLFWAPTDLDWLED
ncbi:MAG: outer membrane lipoprotein carrier protein LolA [Acidobacteria bacterium]|nr:outer membrane lipoprotein carrier protein LolA [Acidobacteriota bacterium]